MARDPWKWSNVSGGSSNAGTEAFTAGSRMLANALDNLKEPLKKGDKIAAENAAARTAGNTGKLLRDIYSGKKVDDKALSEMGYYDSNAIAKAGYQYGQDQQKMNMERQKLAASLARGGKPSLAEQLALYRGKGEIDKEMGRYAKGGKGGKGGGGQPDLVAAEKVFAGDWDMDRDSVAAAAQDYYKLTNESGMSHKEAINAIATKRESNMRGWIPGMDDYDYSGQDTSALAQAVAAEREKFRY